MIAAHLPHIPRIPEWDVRRGLPIRGFFTMPDICTALTENVSILTGIFHLALSGPNGKYAVYVPSGPDCVKAKPAPR